jgi:hypothetical protein
MDGKRRAAPAKIPDRTPSATRMVRSEPTPNGTDVIAALDAVAKPKANAAPRTIVLIINRSLFFRIARPASRF